jgi:hypothetical protein
MESSTPRRRFILAVSVITFVSFLASVAVIVATNNHPVHADGTWYADVAQALAAGKGYQEPHDYWPGRPTAWKPPLWPALESIAMRAYSNRSTAAHAAGLILHGVTILGIVLLTSQLSGSPLAMLIAGLGGSLWPGALAAIVGGGSEPCAAGVLVTGTWLIRAGGKRFWCGVLVLSLMPLVRPNFLALPFVAAGILVILRFRSPGRLHAFGNPASLLIAAAVFYLPSTVWVVRNYLAIGVFPLFVNEGGATIYGSYNSVTANAAEPAFATCLVPSFIPGEEPKALLAKRMSETEVNRYYEKQGMRFIRARSSVIPRIIVGHVRRAMRPQEAMPAALRYPEWICRLVLYSAALLLLVLKRPSLPPWYGLLLGATAVTVSATVVVFFFEQRYIYPLTVLLISFVPATWLGHRKGASVLNQAARNFA